jgi:hypothetical protein
MNYHTNIVPSPVKESSAKEEKLVDRSYTIPRRNTYLSLKRSFDVVFSLLFCTTPDRKKWPLISLFEIPQYDRK